MHTHGEFQQKYGNNLKNQMEILEIKDTLSKMQNLLADFLIRELED